MNLLSSPSDQPVHFAYNYLKKVAISIQPNDKKLLLLIFKKKGTIKHYFCPGKYEVLIQSGMRI